MRRQIISLVLEAIILICWSVVGINRAVTAPSWLCLLDGGIMMVYFLMTIDNIRDLVKAVKASKTITMVQEPAEKGSADKE